MSAEEKEWPQEVEEKLYPVSNERPLLLGFVRIGDKHAVGSLTHQ